MKKKKTKLNRKIEKKHLEKPRPKDLILPPKENLGLNMGRFHILPYNPNIIKKY